MRDELIKVVTSSATQRERGAAFDASNTGLPPPDAFAPEAEGDDDYAAYEHQRQTQIMHEQDEALDGVFQTVENLRGQATSMGRELEEQGEMLEDVEGVTDRVGGKLTGGTKRLGEIIRRNEGWSIGRFQSFIFKTNFFNRQILCRAVVSLFYLWCSYYC